MKRRVLLKQIEDAGCVLLRRGSRHDIYHNPNTGRSEPLLRHREINEILAKRIISRLVEP
mgnify:CR=1 FL=1|jgi:hypothetical protein